MWIQEKMPLVPGLDITDPSKAKRFSSCPLNYLVSDATGLVRRATKMLKITKPEDAIRFVIEKIDYPLTVFGQDNDSHIEIAFGGRVVLPIFLDYWAADHETMLTYLVNRKLGKNGYGDCEDTSILMGSLLRELGIPYYVCMGMVYRGTQLLGGHAWTIAKLPEYGWALIETTLDRMPAYPNGFPLIDPSTNIYTVGSLIYVAYFRFNHEKFEVISLPKANKIGYTTWYDEYLNLSYLDKNRKEKFDAISAEWGIPSKVYRSPKVF